MSQLKKLIRKEFREAVFERDGNTCKVCGEPAVDAHHITDRNEMPNGGYVATNGISLCSECHKKAEVFHQTGQPFSDDFTPDALYKLIDSSYELALEQSNARLG